MNSFWWNMSNYLERCVSELAKERQRTEYHLSHANKWATSEDLSNQICIMNMFMPHYSHLVYKFSEHFATITCRHSRKTKHLGENSLQGAVNVFYVVLFNIWSSRRFLIWGVNSHCQISGWKCRIGTWSFYWFGQGIENPANTIVLFGQLVHIEYFH